MTGGETIVQGILLAFALVVILMPAFIRVVRRLGMGKRIRVEGPESHYTKEGTPTLGGLLIISVVGGVAIVMQMVSGNFIDGSTFAPLATLALVGVLGTADDWLNARTGDGIRGRQKLLWQSVVALVAAWQIQQTYQIHGFIVPLVGLVAVPAWAYVLFAAFAIVATSNGVNLSDGLDGLCGGLLIFAFVGYMAIAAVAAPLAQPHLAVLCALIIGSLLGFLWFNVHPAQIFMGDSGSLSLGATLAVTALITGQILLLPLIGIIFVLEAGSVIAQVSQPSAARQAHPADEPAAPPLRAAGVAGGQGHAAFLDRRHPRLAGRCGLRAGHQGTPGVMAVSSLGVEPIDLATLSLASFAGRPVAVLGFARSGIALARFLHDRRALVTVYDARPADQLADALAGLEGRTVRLLLGPGVDPSAALAEQALICTSPSVSSRYPTTEPRLRAALAQLEAEGRTPVVSEMDLFLRLCPAQTIGVTGTKGKTTTSSLCAAILAAGHEPVLLGGNIGTPLVERLPELTPRHRVVLELSELQLPTISRGTDVAVYTHVSSDHLDRHGDVDSYRAVKRRLAELVPAGGVLVLNDEDPVSAPYADAGPGRVVRYRRSAPPSGGLGVVEGWIVADGVERLAVAGGGPAATGPGGRVVPLERIGLPGAHNRSNVAAAVAVGLLFGIAPDAIADAVAAFAGVEHRLEPVAQADGVRYVNDSQGTQPDAVIAALRSFPRPLVLICGGRAKGLPIDELARVAAERASAAVVIGESGPELRAAFEAAGLVRCETAPTLEAAVVRADAICRELVSADRPGTVLLSPAAASFDMFVDYAARGRAFKVAVGELLERRRAGALS